MVDTTNDNTIPTAKTNLMPKVTPHDDVMQFDTLISIYMTNQDFFKI